MEAPQVLLQFLLHHLFGFFQNFLLQSRDVDSGPLCRFSG